MKYLKDYRERNSKAGQKRPAGACRRFSRNNSQKLSGRVNDNTAGIGFTSHNIRS